MKSLAFTPETKLFDFKVLMPDGKVVTQDTAFKKKDGSTVRLNTAGEVIGLLVRTFLKNAGATSLQQYCDETTEYYNDPENGYELTNYVHGKREAIDEIANTYQVNFNKKHVHIGQLDSSFFDAHTVK